MTLPLEGVRVLDLSRLLPGGYATMVLADLGAEVTKVEEPGRGDYVRWMPPFTATGESAMHLAINRGKRSVTCDLRRDEGRELLRRLVREADVLVESFRPGVMQRLGVGYDVLREDNRGLVYVAITGFGAEGPYSAVAGHDIDYLAYAGALSLNGHPMTGPYQPALQIGDLGGGAWPAVVAVLAALRVRDATGEGQFCDISMADGVLSWMGHYLAAWSATGVVPGIGTEMLNGGLACYAVYECADGGHLAVGALEPQFFAVLLEGLGLSELAAWHLDPAYQSALRARLAEAFRTRTRDEWVEVYAGTDACVAPVYDLAEAATDPNAVARGAVAQTALPDGTTVAAAGVVPRLCGTPGRLGGVPSRLGADTPVVLRDLGYSDDEAEALREAGVV